jgi:hypothetical protein
MAGSVQAPTRTSPQAAFTAALPDHILAAVFAAVRSAVTFSLAAAVSSSAAAGPRFGFGFFLPVLPAFYATYWWGGIPYYYANDAYYTWSPNYNGYVATDPPAGPADNDGQPLAAGSQAPASGQTYEYPKNGQTDEQQANDRYQCHQWAVSQSGYDPTANGTATTGQGNYHRALTACMEGRGYSVR